MPRVAHHALVYTHAVITWRSLDSQPLDVSWPIHNNNYSTYSLQFPLKHSIRRSSFSGHGKLLMCVWISCFLDSPRVVVREETSRAANVNYKLTLLCPQQSYRNNNKHCRRVLFESFFIRVLQDNPGQRKK